MLAAEAHTSPCRHACTSPLHSNRRRQPSCTWPGGHAARKAHRNQAGKAAAHHHHVHVDLLAVDVGRQVAAVRVVCRGG